ncbi:MAG: FAD-dependent oxidoreductase [Clostridia bacterium]
MEKKKFVLENQADLKTLVDSFGDWWNKGFETPSFSQSEYPYSKLFEPIKIGKLMIKNRCVMGPMGNINMCEETGRPNQKMISYFEERAKGGVGLITTGLIPISYGIDHSITEKGGLSYFPRIDRSRTVFSGWRDLTKAVHSQGSHIFIQLTAGLGRVGNPECLVKQLKFPVSASFNPNYYIKQVPCLPLSNCALKKIIKNAGQAAADSRAAGLDGVYLHGHEGYLMEQLANTAFNRRKLGRFASWQQFGIDMVSEIRARVGTNFPILFRIDLSLALNETYGDKMQSVSPLKKFKNERTIEQTIEYMENLVLAGVDAFDVDLGCYDNWWLPHPPTTMPSGCFLSVSEFVKKHFRTKGIRSNLGEQIPIIGVGKLGFPDLAEKALADGKCDMIMLARPLLADPEWVNKVQQGKVDEICPCIGCHDGCIKEFVDGGHPQCSVNFRTGFEDVIPTQIDEAKEKKTIAVVGAGPAGIVASEILLERGHNVTMFDASPLVGGMLKIASIPKFKYELKEYLLYLERKVEKMKLNKHFSLKLSSVCTVESLKVAGFDEIVVATGSAMNQPKILGFSDGKVMSVVEFYEKNELSPDVKNVVIIGGGEAGMECANYLAFEKNKIVTVIESDSVVMKNSCTANRGHLIHEAERAGVQILNSTVVSKICENKTIEIIKNISSAVPNPFNTWQPILPENIKNPFAKNLKEEYEKQTISADLIIYAYGSVSKNALYFQLVKANAAKNIHYVGDAFKVQKVYGAVYSAARMAMQI